MLELFAFRPELEETLEVIDLSKDSASARARRLLRLAIHHLLLGDLNAHLSELRALESAIDLDSDLLDVKHRLQIAVARGLIYEDPGDGCGVSQYDVVAALERAAGDWYTEAVVADAGLALSMLEGDKSKISDWMRRRCRIPPVLSYTRLSIELLYFASLLERDECRFSPKLIHQAAYAGVCAAMESGDFMAPVLAAVSACAMRSGTTLKDLLNGGADLLDRDLFPYGLDEDCRVEVSDPSFWMTRASGGRAIEVRIAVRGSGGMIGAAGPVLDGLVLAWPSHLLALVDRELAVTKIRHARRRSDIDAVLADPAGRVDAVIELEEGLSLSDVDRTAYADRVVLAADWVRALRPDFRARCGLRVAGSPAP
jgi:hypothetical protein